MEHDGRPGFGQNHPVRAVEAGALDECKRADAQHEVLTRALRLLGRCSTLLIQAENETELLALVCKLAVETAGYKMAWVGFIDGADAGSPPRMAAQYGGDGAALAAAISMPRNPADPIRPSWRATIDARTVVVDDTFNDSSMAPWREAAARYGYRSSIACPLFIGQQVCGVMSIYAQDPFSFTAAEVALLEELAGNLSFGIASLRTRAESEETKQLLTRQNARYLALLQNASDGIHIVNAEGRLIEASEAFCCMLGYRHEEMIGMHIPQWDAHMTNPQIDALVAEQMANPRRIQFETTHRRKDGTTLEVEVSCNTIHVFGQTVLFNSSRDITARKHAADQLAQQQRQLAESETRYRELLENLHTAVVVHAPDTRIIFSNPRASELLGLPVDQMQGKVAIDPAWCFIDERGATMPVEEYPVNLVRATRKPLQALLLGVKTPVSSAVTWLLVSAFPDFDSDGSLKQIVVNFDDISARKKAEEKVHHMAFFDLLTGLPNRRLLMDRLHATLAGSARNHYYGAVLFIDLDKFKSINDVRGHDAGDLLLVAVAERIRACVREEDTVARLGGDEFVVLLSEIGAEVDTASQKSALVAEKIRLALNVPFKLKGYVHHTSPSIGVSVFHGAAEAPEALLRQADMAMYKAKDAGRNTLRFFNAAMQLAVETHAALEADLRHAVPNGELRLYYQLQVDNQQRPVGAEALARWVHPTRGAVSPTQFIPIAEESSLILDIGEWVLDTACAQLARWAGFDHLRQLTLAVNVSAQQFRQPEFVEAVAAVLAQHEFDHSRLKLELTESVIVNDVDDVVNKMHRLRDMGLTLSMDDFGTGYSSLSYLKQLPLHQIKIDQSFTRDITTDPADAVMVKTIIDLAVNFRLQVIAEGVETQEQLDFLQQHGCMAYQGYLFGKPMPIERFEALAHFQCRAGVN